MNYRNRKRPSSEMKVRNKAEDEWKKSTKHTEKKRQAKEEHLTHYEIKTDFIK